MDLKPFEIRVCDLPIHPIEYRYGSPAMKRIFSRESWLEKMLLVEATLVQAYADVGEVSRKAADYISARASLKYVSLEDVDRYEKITDHEVMAVVKALSDACGPYGAYIHLGATSSDITDTVLALQLKEALEIVDGDLKRLAEALIHKAIEYRDTICLGRTHGIAALPMPFGFKFAVWAAEVKRHRERLSQCLPRVCVGKMSGAIGTMAGLGPHAMEVQNLVMKRLGIRAAEISTQIVPRDGLAELMVLLALISSSLEKMANEIRNLQRTEIREVEEPFVEATQVGSSTMPHKRNPIKSEKVCGLARIIRGFATAALENVVLEHERDLTNSSCERSMVPEVLILLDEQLKTLIRVIEGLVVYPENMRRNMEATKGLLMSEAVMLAMARKGAPRQWAHEVLRQCSMEALRRQVDLKDVLKEREEVRRYLSLEEIEEAMNPFNYLGTSREQIERIVEDVRASLTSKKEAS
jgi:adenylosuccinate lyase